MTTLLKNGKISYAHGMLKYLNENRGTGPV
jgi:hypothetical protein